jgi:hypothetical protein
MQMRTELVAAAALVEATAMVADLVVAMESAKVKVITLGPMARAMLMAVAPEMEAEVVMMVGSAAVLVADRGTAAVLQQVTTMVAAMGQRLKIHLVE